ncbi:LLM class F420-dependent oxidoreductase, partial [Spirillospora sp. NPDC046719]
RSWGPHSFVVAVPPFVLHPPPPAPAETPPPHVRGYVQAAEHQRASVRRLGYGDDDQTGGPGGGPSDRLVDAIVAHGDVDAIRARVREHLDAGADHVCVQVLTADPAELPLEQWRELAPALL